MRFGTGARAYFADPRDLPAEELVGSAGVLPQDVMFAGYAMHGMQQAQTNSCVGFATSQAIWITQGVNSIPSSKRVMPSPGAIYAQALRRGGIGAVDAGCYPRDAWASLRDLGVVSIWDHPVDLEKITKLPSVTDYRAAVDRDWLRYYWVLEDGAKKVDRVKALLAQHRPVAMSLQVDDGFMNLDKSSEPWLRSGASLGGHYVVAAGYSPQGVYIVGSYGPSWGDSGCAWVSWEAVEDDECTSLVVPEIDMERLIA